MPKDIEVLTAEVCPYCGAKEPLIGTLAEKQVEKGVDPKNLPGCLMDVPFVVAKEGPALIIGARAPAGKVYLDICRKCLGVYAVRVEIGEAVLSEMMRGIPPGLPSKFQMKG